MDSARLLRACADAQLAGLGCPFIVAQCPHGSWFHLRNVCPPVLVEELRGFADREEDEFYHVHCKKTGDIARIVLDCSLEHKAELKKYGEDGVVTQKPEGKVLAGALSRVWDRCANATPDSFECGEMGEAELGRSMPKSRGQHKHMDNPKNLKSLIVNTGKPGEPSSATAIAVYPWQPYPANMSTASTVPTTSWDRLPVLLIQWQSGDAIIMYQNRVHGAPENPTDDYRVITFCGQRGESFSDSTVVTRDVFLSLLRCNTHICTTYDIIALYSRCVWILLHDSYYIAIIFHMPYIL